MKRLIQHVVLLTLVIFIFINHSEAQKSFEGYWEQQTITKSSLPGAPTTETKEQRFYYKPEKMKMVDLNTGDIIIYRFDKELMWNINKATGTYTEMKFSDMQAGMQKVSEAMKEMQNEMKDMSPDERKMMEKMMGKKMNTFFGSGEEPKISIKKTGESKTINGFKCYKVIFYTNDEPLFDMWMTNKYQLGSEFIEIYQKMGFLKGKIPNEAKKIKGLPIQTQFKMNTGMGKMETVSTTTKIVPKSISDSEFELPKGLKKKAFSAMP